MGLLGKLFGGSPEENAKKAADKALRREIRTGELLAKAKGSGDADCGGRMDAALSLFLEEAYPAAREGYASIMVDCPGRRAEALGQIGACFHMEGDYSAAIARYEEAIQAGGDAEMLQENMDESRKALG